MKQSVEKLLAQALESLKQSSLIANELTVEIKVKRVKDTNQGDFSTNLPMLLARNSNYSGLQLADFITKNIPFHAAIKKIEIAGPGFINFFIDEKAQAQVIAEVLQKGELFGQSDVGKDSKAASTCWPLWELAKEKSKDNKISSIQYAHARSTSVLQQLQDFGLNCDEEKGLAQINTLVEPQEMALISHLGRYPEVKEAAASTGEPRKLLNYLSELATGLHSYFNTVQLLCEKKSMRSARLCLLKALRQVLQNGLQSIGISTPESM